MENLHEQLRELPANLAGHLRITVLPLLFAVGAGLPLAVAAARRRRLRYPLLTAVGVIQTVPGLALLALMVPLLAVLGAFTSRAFGFEVPALGFWPAALALWLYGMLPILRNGVAGLAGVDPPLVEAARGMGMTSRQILWRVQLPLAAPVILAGVRTATVWVVGMATLATPVGQRSLGNYIFSGLHTRNWTAVLFGCAAAAALAIVLDLALGGIERAVAERRRGLGLASAGLLALLVGAGFAAPALVGRGGGREAVIVGSKTFTEQYVLAALIKDVLEDRGFRASERQSLGSTVIFDALAHGDVDVCVDYTGTIWANHMGREGGGGAQEVLAEVSRWLESEHGIVCLGPLGFENAYGLAMRRERAGELGIASIADLARRAPDLSLGADYEFLQRPEWRRIRDLYGLRFAGERSYDPNFMYEALARGQVDVISAFTSDGRIEAFDLVVLADPAGAIPPYDAVLLLSAGAAARPGLAEALRPLAGAIPVEAMRRASLLVDRREDPLTVRQAARRLREWAAAGAGASRRR